MVSSSASRSLLLDLPRHLVHLHVTRIKTTATTMSPAMATAPDAISSFVDAQNVCEVQCIGEFFDSKATASWISSTNL